MFTFERREIAEITGHPDIRFKVVHSVEDIISTSLLFIWIIRLTSRHIEFTITENSEIKERFVLTNEQLRAMQLLLSTEVVNNLLT